MTAKRKTLGDVSCLAVRPLLGFAESQGVPAEKLAAGLSYTIEQLRDPHRWITIQNFTALEKRLAELLPDESDLFFKVGQSVIAAKSFGFLRFVIRFYTNEINMYKASPKIVQNYLFSFANINLTQLSKSKLQLQYSIDKNIQVSDHFWETARGVYTILPTMIGSPRALVSISNRSANGAVLNVQFTGMRTGLFRILSYWFKKLIFIFKTRPATLIEVSDELQESNLLLQEKIDSITSAQTELRKLNQRLVQIREDEATRISRELHDELGQLLTGLKIEVGLLARRVKNDNLPDASYYISRIDQMSGVIEKSIQTTRTISQDLRPPMLDDVGLAGTLKWMAKNFSHRTGLQCETNIELSANALDPTFATAVYRIVQESLTNIARHARANRAWIAVEQNGQGLTATIRDDGIGFDDPERIEHKSVGLLGMKERAHSFGGTVSIEGTAGEGTTVRLQMPIASS